MLETRREKIVIFGAAPVILLLFYLLLVGGGEADEEVALAPPPGPRAAVAIRPTPPPAAPPAPVQARQSAALAVAADPPAPTTAITLTGVLGTGRGGSAIISYAGGAQRLITVGRDVLPGLTLREVRRDRVLLSGPAGPMELRFGSAATVGQIADAPSGAAPSARSAEAAARVYVRAMEPQRVGGRVVGYQIRSASDLPLLGRAGLRPGDVLLAVNGNAIDGQERLTSIPAEIAGTPFVDVEFERGGRKMRTRIAAQ